MITVMQFMLTGCSCRVSFMVCFYLNIALSVDQLLQKVHSHSSEQPSQRRLCGTQRIRLVSRGMEHQMPGNKCKTLKLSLWLSIFTDFAVYRAEYY